MKKKNITLQKLKLSKTQIASLEQSQQAVGGTDFTMTTPCTVGCTEPPPPPPQPTEMTGCLCPSDPTACFPTEQNCGTNQSCDPGEFLCVNGF